MSARPATRFGCGLDGRVAMGEHRLDLHGADANVQLSAGDLANQLGSPLSDRSQDLLEIAAYISAADQATSRGSSDDCNLETSWRRDLALRIAVRDRPFWTRKDVVATLTSAVSWATDDDYAFKFVAAPARSLALVPLKVATPAELFRAERVVAFSGGLDSLAGAAATILDECKSTALVSMRTATKLDPMQDSLAARLAGAAGLLPHPPSVRHIGLRLRHTDAIDAERTHRSRSFVVVAICSVVARALGLDTVHLFENGVVSVNLPISAQLVGSRATRTTHPLTLARFNKLLSLVFERAFSITNPYLTKTKVDVLRVLSDLKLASLIPATVSCGATTKMTSAGTHCGTCTQCIDRKLAILAAGLEDVEPNGLYRKSAIDGALDGIAATAIEGYFQRARIIDAMTEEQFLLGYPELSRVFSSDLAAVVTPRQLYELHRRHASEVLTGTRRAMDSHTGRIGKGSLLSLVIVPKTGAARAALRAPDRSTGDRVRVLHLSDTHFSTKRWHSDLLLKHLATDIETFTTNAEWFPDLIVWTGDIAMEGKREQFRLADEWLTQRILPMLRLSAERVVVVPGNHDVDRAHVTRMTRLLRDDVLGVGTQDRVGAMFNTEDERRQIHAPLAEFVSFMRSFSTSLTGEDSVWRSQIIKVGGRTVHVAGLCTSFFAYDKNDQGKLVVGMYQLAKTLDPDIRADLTIALLHHPTMDLAEFDRAPVAKYLRTHSQLTLHGHVHDPDVVNEVRADSNHYTIAGGAADAGLEFANAYHFIEWDFADHALRVWPRRWTGTTWDADRNAFGGSPDGRLERRLAAQVARDT